MFKYCLVDSISFRKTTEQFGGLSNMAKGYPLLVNNVRFYTSEALYQACKFPDYPAIQDIILNEASPMTAKMKMKPFKEKIRKDWLDVRVDIMEWCICVKLFQHPNGFGSLLLLTKEKNIVEDSWKDTFWGAKRHEEYFEGQNTLGRLLMRLRDFWIDNQNKQLRSFLSPPKITDAYLFGMPIQNVTYHANLEQEGEFIRQKKKHDTQKTAQCEKDQIGLLSFCHPSKVKK